jgi:Xaa-Pro aminopeptidase
MNRILLALSLLLFTAGVAHGQIPTDEYATRRAALADRLGDGILLAVGSAAPPQDYISFHQNSLFRYLTGFTEPDAALLLEVRNGEVREILFVNPRDPGRETWEGLRMGPDASLARTGIPGRHGGAMESVLDSLLAVAPMPAEIRVVGPYQPGAPVVNDVTQRILRLLEGHPDVSIRPVNSQLNALRAIKSPAELDLIRHTVALTVEAHRAVTAYLAPDRGEFEIQAVVEHTFRRYGAERTAFASIVGSGPNSTILHYNTNQRMMEDGDVVVVDIGANFQGYSADVTRTYPVNGRFTPEQRLLYQLVRDAQAAAEGMAGPGARMAEMNAAAAHILAEGLAAAGLIESPDATYETDTGARAPQLRLFYIHGLGHGVGLDVHDPAPDPLEPGSVISIEPGIYVRPNLLDEVIPPTPANQRMIEAIRPAVERFKGIGIRIEDDYIITAEGAEWISPAPREVEEIESLLATQRGGDDRRLPWIERMRGMP